MSSDPPPDRTLSEPEAQTLRLIYDALRNNGSWPTFQYVSAIALGEMNVQAREVYYRLSELALVRPVVGPNSAFQLREETTVELSILGLAAVPGASEDLALLMALVRYVGGEAQRFRPADPSTVGRLEVTSTQFAAFVGLDPENPAILRVGQLAHQVTSMWSSFSGPGDDGWSMTVQVESARRFAPVKSLADYLRLGLGGERQPDDDGMLRTDRTGGPSLYSPSPEGVSQPDRSGENAPKTESELEAERDRAPKPYSEADPDSQADPDADSDSEQGDSSEQERNRQLTFRRSVTADLPSTKDLLGFGPLVKALHGLLNDSSTALPLAIAVSAPWGAGKSSVMTQLQVALEEPAGGVAGQRTWATVRFDAWKYERGERLWAALAKAIYRQPQRRMSWKDRLVFRVRLELRRRGRLASLATVAWPCLVLAALGLAVSEVNISGVAAIPAVIAAAAVILATLTRYGEMLANPFKRSIERHARRPDYEAQLGFTAEADRDIRVLMRLIAPDDDHGLAVFVDDLDRCSSAHLVEVVEAMNQIFNSSSDHRCVFVLGLDREVVASNINVAYAGTVEQLRSDGNPLGERFGLEFLAKLVQLTVSLPEPTPQALRGLLETITGALGGDGERSLAPGDEEVARVQAEIQSAADERLSSVTDAAASFMRVPQDVLAEATRRELTERFEDSPEVAQAEFHALRFLERNPRQVKRFHNAFRLQLYVASEDDAIPFDFTAEQLVALSKWVVVRLRWPDLGNAIAQDPGLLRLIEAQANDEPFDVPPELAQHGRIKDREMWLAQAGVSALMVETDRDRRLSSLELKRFLRVA